MIMVQMTTFFVKTIDKEVVICYFIIDKNNCQNDKIYCHTEHWWIAISLDICEISMCGNTNVHIQNFIR